MKICAISDTHSLHESVVVPESDVLICSGDISYKGEPDIVNSFISWFGKQKAQYKILIFGNHEVGYSNHLHKKFVLSQKLIKQNNIIYLQNSEVVIDNFKFYGSPATPYFYGWEWNYHRGPDISKIWDKIPLDTDVLITHGPAYSILDYVPVANNRDPHQGCKDLLNKISNLNLKAHICGHIHGSYGKIIKNETIFINACICDESYKATNAPIIFEI